MVEKIRTLIPREDIEKRIADLKVDKRTPIINQDYNKKTIEESGFEVKNKYE